MKHIVLLFLTFLAMQAKAKTENKKSTQGRSNHLNLTLETAFIFDPKDAYHDLSLIKFVRDFLESLEGQIANKTSLRSAPGPDDFRLSDFVYHLGKSLLTYTEQHIRSITNTLQDVVEDYYPTEQFKKLFFDPRLKSFVKNSIKIWSEMDPKEIQRQIKTMFIQPTYNETFTNFLYTISNFYDKSESKILFKLSDKFTTFPNKQMKLKKNIEKSLSYIIFDKFKHMDVNEKTTLVKELGHLADYVGTHFDQISSVIDDEASVKKRTSENVTLSVDHYQQTYVPPQDQPKNDRESPMRSYDSTSKVPRVESVGEPKEIKLHKRTFEVHLKPDSKRTKK